MADPRKELPPGYVKLVETLMRLIVQWCGEQPGLPDLRWLDPGDTMFIGGLQGSAVKMLADSPDAFRLIEWLDVQTDRKATIFQATMALRMLGHLPGGPEPEEVSESAAFRSFARFAKQTAELTRMPPSACTGCGRSNNCATGEEGHHPEPGSFSVCGSCGGLNQYGDDLSLLPVTEATLDALPAPHRAQLLEMQARMRAARMQSLSGKRTVEATNRPAPRSTGKPPAEIVLTGMFLPWYAGTASCIDLPGAGDTYLKAVVVFSTVAKLEAAVKLIALPCERIKKIDEHWEFLASIPADLLVVVDPWITPEGTTRYMQVLRD